MWSNSKLPPYLSVVVTSRNDNHGGDLVLRMQTFLDALAELCAKYRLTTEVIFVEWNPPSDHARLFDALRWPESNGYCQYRIIEVPPELHATLDVSDRLPLFQMIAKNVGIRRARGRYILATNIDLIFSDRIMRWLSRQSLRPGVSYRIDRYDVPLDVMAIPGLQQQLDYCSKNLLRVHVAHGTMTGEDWNRYAKATRISSALASIMLAWPQKRAELKALSQLAFAPVQEGWARSQLAMQSRWARLTATVSQLRLSIQQQKERLYQRAVRQVASVASACHRVASACQSACRNVKQFTVRVYEGLARRVTSVGGRLERLAKGAVAFVTQMATMVGWQLLQGVRKLAHVEWGRLSLRLLQLMVQGDWQTIRRHLNWNVGRVDRKLQKGMASLEAIGRHVLRRTATAAMILLGYARWLPSILAAGLRELLDYARKVSGFAARHAERWLDRGRRLLGVFLKVLLAPLKLGINGLLACIQTFLTICQLEWLPDFTPWERIVKGAATRVRNLASFGSQRNRRLHTNACGDFTLMSREDWIRLGGYAEFPMYSWHIDSLFLYAADAAGIKETVVPYPVYHIEHGGGWSPESCDMLFGRLRQRNIPFLTNEDLAMLDQRIRSMNGVCQLTGPDWGFAHSFLPQFEPQPKSEASAVTPVKPRERLAA